MRKVRRAMRAARKCRQVEGPGPAVTDGLEFIVQVTRFFPRAVRDEGADEILTASCRNDAA
ncbi:hypothetical protein AB0I02_45600 [Streptomyces phaeochromogenes]